MDRKFYVAAKEGNIDDLRQIKDQLDVQLTPNNNTILHVAAQFHDSRECAKEILKMEPSLICWVNSKGETALHIAARKGHSNTVRELIACAKSLEDLESGAGIIEMFWMTNEDNDTALHEAVRNKHLDVVKLLIEEAPECLRAANNSEETPLYLAAERNYCDIVSTIFGACTSPAHSGPNGRTALHAAVFSRCSGCVQIILDGKPNLAKEADIYGWTPLHCAARLNFVNGVMQLLNADKSIAYVTANNDDNKTALHIAASQGNVEAMEEILKHCPDCWEVVNGRGQNILHIAIENEKRYVIKFIVKNWWLNDLLNQKDIDGNTPLHLVGASDFFINQISELVNHRGADYGAFNKDNLTPLDMATSTDFLRFHEDDIIGELKKIKAPSGWRNIVREDNDLITNEKKARAEEKKMRKDDTEEQNYMLVAALIATVTFAAGFTLPGGYDGNEGPDKGLAVLMRKAAFKAFVISNTIALVFSVSALFAFVIASSYRQKGKTLNRQVVGIVLILIAIGAMMIAFITGTFAVLPNSSSLAIAVCVIACFFFLIYYILLHKIFRDN